MLTITERLVRIVSCFFEVVHLLLSVIHDALPYTTIRSGECLLSADEKAALEGMRGDHARKSRTSIRDSIVPIPATIEEAAAQGKRLVLVDFENSSQGIAEILFQRQADLSPDVMCCIVSQHRPDFMVANKKTDEKMAGHPSFHWFKCQGGRKEAADELIESIVMRFSATAKIYLVHGGDHRWFEVSEKYGVPHHVVQGGKRHALNEYKLIKEEWKI